MNKKQKEQPIKRVFAVKLNPKKVWEVLFHKKDSYEMDGVKVELTDAGQLLTVYISVDD